MAIIAHFHAHHSGGFGLAKTATALLTAAGWIVQGRKDANLAAGRGVAVGEFPLKPGHGEADYLLFKMPEFELFRHVLVTDW